MGQGLLVAGTTSDAGKTVVTTGICRALARRGLSVAPFKAQNMSNNSMVALDPDTGAGVEIGRAQWIQAVRTSASDPSSWVKVTGVFVLQLLAVLAFWLDARRQRRRKRERSAAVVFGTVLATGILFALVTRGGFALAQALSPSLEGASGAVYYAIPFAAASLPAILRCRAPSRKPAANSAMPTTCAVS